MLEFGFYEKEVGVMQHFDQFEDETGDQLRAEFELRIGKNVTFQFLGFCCLHSPQIMHSFDLASILSFCFF